ncbi:MAG: 23S rRNA (uracil(1939)-C(5))-methyltransferase RlmD [Streptococcaceae bacterium]|nr:23S rRNA (uracil(1939)-C(5))-methyltransferase RlmD [Streptococcaceae bacterium]
MNLEKNQTLIVEIIDLTHEGLGVAKLERYPLFIENALPGEIVEVLIMKLGKKFGFAKVVKYLEKSDKRNDEIEVALLRTGIADLGHLAYPQQLEFKRQQIVNLLKKTSQLASVDVAKTIGMAQPFAYRNKAQIPVRKVDGVLQTGFFRKHSHDLVPIENYYIQDKVIDQIVLKCRDLFRKFNLKAYDEQAKTGLIKNVVVRRGRYSGEVMVVIVSTKPKIFRIDELVHELVAAFPAIKSVMQNIHPFMTNNIFSSEFQILYGQDFITDSLLGNQFKINALSFYQVNTEMAEILYQKAIELANLQVDDVVIDAYCGIGTIGQSIAKCVQHVYGVEIVPEAIINAQENGILNGLNNLTYEVGRAEDILPKWINEGIKPSVFIIDPPRKGLAESFIQASAATSPEKIVYVSCNPATFIRDAALYNQFGYQLKQIIPVDLFPQTKHVELVGLITKKK